MKLNNNGWGTIQMLLLSGGLLVALIVAIYFIGSLYGSFSGAVGNKQYMDLETKLEEAAKEYVDSNSFEINGEFTISYTTLKSYNFIDDLKDIDGNDCNGYVKISNIDNINHYTGFISCKNYITTNY